jgi:hypothetical protein
MTNDNSSESPFPRHLTTGTNGIGTREHALCDNTLVVAEVLPFGYPMGKEWDPRSALRAKEIAYRYNTPPQLLEALCNWSSG